MDGPIRIGVVGLGKIARDQHLPAIASNEKFSLIAIADPHTAAGMTPCYRSQREMIAAGGIDAVAICTPPASRHGLAREAIAAGLSVMLEKPPAATMSEAFDLRHRADLGGTTLFATWHSREAAGVAGAKAWLAGRTIVSMQIDWREDIRRWHPGQEWILGPGGFGVFDPAINALSILTELAPGPIVVARATVTIPEGRAAPLAATMQMRLENDAPVDAEFDFLQTGEQTWTISVATDRGTMTLADGGAKLVIDGRSSSSQNREYPRLYDRFAALIASGTSDIDIRPLQLVADAYLIADHKVGPPFKF